MIDNTHNKYNTDAYIFISYTAPVVGIVSVPVCELSSAYSHASCCPREKEIYKFRRPCSSELSLGNEDEFSASRSKSRTRLHFRLNFVHIVVLIFRFYGISFSLVEHFLLNVRSNPQQSLYRGNSYSGRRRARFPFNLTYAA